MCVRSGNAQLQGGLYRDRLARQPCGLHIAPHRVQRAQPPRARRTSPRAPARPAPAPPAAPDRGPAPPSPPPGRRDRRGRPARAALAVTSARPPRSATSSGAPQAIASSAIRPNGSGQRLGTTAMPARDSAASTSRAGSSRACVTPAASAARAQRAQEGCFRAVGAEAVGADHLGPPARQVGQRAGAGLRRRHPPPCRPPRGRRTAAPARAAPAAARRTCRCSWAGSPAARHFVQPVQQPVAHGPDTVATRASGAEQEQPLGRAAGAAHALRVVVQEQQTGAGSRPARASAISGRLCTSITAGTTPPSARTTPAA